MTTPQPNYGITFADSNSESTNQLSAQEHATLFIKDQIADPNYTHEISASQLWAIKKDSTFHLLSAHPDVYDMLEYDYDLSSYQGIIIHTTGWAAPLNEDGEVDGKPSSHPDKRRVALAACVTDTSVGSALSFSDDGEIITDPGSATGTLADALLTFWQKNR